MIVKRTLYLGYYFKQMKWDLLKKFLEYASKETGKSKNRLLRESIADVYRYNISILEYFQFGFYDKSKSDKATWAGTGTMYEFQKRVNPVETREILEDKRLFYRNYNEFFKHKLYTLEELEADSELVATLIKSHKRLVLKEAEGKVGSGVHIIQSSSVQASELCPMMRKNGYDLLETYVQQHAALQELSPTAVNTIRIFTQIRKDGTYEILGCRLRISVDSPVDNMGAGNLAAPIDDETGTVNGPGVYSDITKKPQAIHPITKVPIVGFQIPFWDEILRMIKEASLKHPQNRSIGWDVAVTESGPELIEGNHDWCKLVWQLPVNKGLKNKLDV